MIQHRRDTYTSRIGWRGEILAVEYAVGAKVTRVCILASIWHDLGTIAVNEGKPIREETVAAFSGTTTASGTGDDSLLALRNQRQPFFS